jgi:5-methylcytosine-specific restriction endonuclease McrA
VILLSDAFVKGQVIGGREKPTLLITIDIESFNAGNDKPGISDRGDRIPAHVVRRLAENAVLQRVLTIGSRVLDLGHDVRYASEQQYRALVVRDGGCRWPGCHIPASWCEVDHLTPFAEHGASDLCNLVLWCSHHHHEKHRPGVQVRGDAHSLRLRLANGEMLDCQPRTRATAAAA